MVSGVVEEVLLEDVLCGTCEFPVVGFLGAILRVSGIVGDSDCLAS